MRWKVCGLRTAAAVEAVGRAGADYGGFIFYEPSPRAIGWSDFRRLVQPGLPFTPVMVDVAPSLSRVEAGLEAGFRLFQVHLPLAAVNSPGPSDYAERIRAAGGKLWLAPRIPPGEAFPEAWLPYADGIVLDGYRQDAHGGTGERSDWELFRRLAGRWPETDWILAGGLGPENAVEAWTRTGAPVMDFNSALETAPGVKDPQRIGQLGAILAALRKNPP